MIFLLDFNPSVLFQALDGRKASLCGVHDAFKRNERLPTRLYRLDQFVELILMSRKLFNIIGR